MPQAVLKQFVKSDGRVEALRQRMKEEGNRRRWWFGKDADCPIPLDPLLAAFADAGYEVIGVACLVAAWRSGRWACMQACKHGAPHAQAPLACSWLTGALLMLLRTLWISSELWELPEVRALFRMIAPVGLHVEKLR